MAPGRATFSLAPDEPRPQLPVGLRVVNTVDRRLQDDVLVIIEGVGLPVWTRGNTPYHLGSWQTFLKWLDRKTSPGEQWWVHVGQ